MLVTYILLICISTVLAPSIDCTLMFQYWLLTSYMVLSMFATDQCSPPWWDPQNMVRIDINN